MYSKSGKCVCVYVYVCVCVCVCVCAGGTQTDCHHYKPIPDPDCETGFRPQSLPANRVTEMDGENRQSTDEQNTQTHDDARRA